MSFTNIISRSDADALVPEEVSNVMLKEVTTQSAALQLFTQIRMSSKQTKMPILSALPIAYFVGGDTGLKRTSKMAWDKKFLVAEEIAVIIPIPEAVLDDADYDIWGEVRPRAAEAIARKLDGAVFFGVDKPVSWGPAIVPTTVARGMVIERGSATPEEGGIAEDINQVMALVEESGFDVNGFVAKNTLRARLRGARATDGQKLLDVSTGTIEGQRLAYGMPGLWPAAAGSAELVAGDFREAVVGVRQDVTYKILDQAVISDDDGVIILNLAQQDSVALRVVARYGFEVSNSINYEKPLADERFPFAALVSPGA